MKFYEFGDIKLPHIMLIHGAGWSYWLYLQEAKLLQHKYHVILPVLDGHGELSHLPYTSSEKIADEIVEYIAQHSGGSLFAISGVSLGGQIAIEVLSRNPTIAKKAIIESGLCIPKPFLMKYSKLVYKLFGKLLFSERINKWALKVMPKRMQLPSEVVPLYLRDIIAVTPENMNRVFDTYFRYSMKSSLKESCAEIAYWYGGKEMRCIKESGKFLQSYVSSCEVLELKGYYHSEISAYHPEEWVERATDFWERKTL